MSAAIKNGPAYSLSRSLHWLGILTVCLFAPALSAHEQSLSYSLWLEQAEPPGLRLILKQSSYDLSQLRMHPQEDDYLPRLNAWLQNQFQVRHYAQSCDLRQPRSQRLADGWVRSVLDWDCPDSGPADAPRWHLRMQGLLAVRANHVNLARWRSEEEEASWAFSRSQAERQIGSGPTAPPRLLDYLWLGFEHILQGWDHLAFLLALLLLLRRLRDLLILVTGFTIGHSISLATVMLSSVALDSGAVEILIALSILLLCLENSWRRQAGTWPLPILLFLFIVLAVAGLPSLLLLGLGIFGLCYIAWIRSEERDAQSKRLALCLAFGLIHGMGFAGALSELDWQGLPLASALLGFNLGIELGQLLVVLPLFLILRALPQSPEKSGSGFHTRQTWQDMLNGGAAALASYWLVIRLFPNIHAQ